MAFVVAGANILLGDEKCFDQFDGFINRCTETRDSALDMAKLFKQIKQERTQRHDYHTRHGWRHRRRELTGIGRLCSSTQCAKRGEEHIRKGNVEAKLIATLADCEQQLWKKIYDHL